MSQNENNRKSLSRRRFLGLSGMATAIVSASPWSGPARGDAGGGALATPAPVKKYPIGLELYSVRNELKDNLPETLRKVAQIGYTDVEFYAPYCDWKIPYGKYVRELMEDCGLRCYSTHNPIASFLPGEPMAHAIELNQILGSRLMVLASAPASVTGVEGWKTLAGQLALAVDDLAPHGLSAGFHNHQTEWAVLDGSQRAMDILAANTPREFVLQLDVGTCVAAGADPVAWVRANPGRIKVVHLKDWAPGGDREEKGYRVLFGEGVTPWKELVAALESTGGIEFYLMEQEGSRFSEMETSRRCLNNWKSMHGAV